MRKIDNLNVLIIGDMASGKTSLLNALIREYYIGHTPKEYEENVLYINSLKEQVLRIKIIVNTIKLPFFLKFS